MIGMINNLVSKVVDKVSGPLYAWGPKPAVKRPKLVKSRKCAKARCKKTKKGKCRCA